MKRSQQLTGIVLVVIGGALLAVYFADARTQATLTRWWHETVGDERSTGDVLRDVGDRLQASLPSAQPQTAQTPTPEPLRRAGTAAGGTLTENGVLVETNRHRAEAGMPALTYNNRLAQAAQAKVADMFANQYFEHVAPDGTDVADLAAAAGYDYIVVGENLALGGYEDDARLVAAWMDSPGHRKNILHNRFTEIGVAVQKGMFEGQEVWLAVQEFGKPRSACPAVDETLDARIARNNEQLDAWQAELARQQADIQATSKFHPSYNRKVRAHNELVERYNALLEETKQLVNEYNAQVEEFNACAQA